MNFFIQQRGDKPLVFSLFSPGLSILLLLLGFWTAPAQGAPTINFDDFYGKTSVLGFEFSNKVKTLSGQKVIIKGFMAPPLKAEAQFFVLTKKPMAICPFCSSDADWPEDILVVYLNKKQTFVQFNRRIQVEGILEHGSWTDPETGFVSLLRLRNAKFKAL